MTTIDNVINHIYEYYNSFIEDEEEPPYQEKYILLLKDILIGFHDEIAVLNPSRVNIDDIQSIVRNYIEKINLLNNETDGCFVETGEREDICEFFNYTVNQVISLRRHQISDITEEYRDF